MSGRAASSTLRSRAAGVAFLILTLLGWASSPLFLNYFKHDMDAWTSNGWRYGISALFWLPFLARHVSRGREAGHVGGIWRAALWPAFFNVLGQIAFAWVVYLHIDPGMMTFLLRAQIVFVTIGAFILFPDERRLALLGGYWAGMVLVLCGTIGTIFLGHARPSGAGAMGVLAGLSSGALFGCYALAVRARMQRYSSMVSFSVISLYTAAALVLIMWVMSGDHGAATLRLSGRQWIMLVVSALAGIALGHVFYYASIARIGVASASSILLLQPFLTAAMSRLWFGERLTAHQWAAGCISVLGAGVIIHTQRRLPVMPRRKDK